MFIKLTICLTVTVIITAIHFHLSVIRNASKSPPRPKKKEDFSNSIKIDLADVHVRGITSPLNKGKSSFSFSNRITKKKSSSPEKVSLAYFRVDYEDEEGRELSFESPVMTMPASALRTKLETQRETVVHFDGQNPRNFAMDLQFLGMAN